MPIRSRRRPNKQCAKPAPRVVNHVTQKCDKTSLHRPSSDRVVIAVVRRPWGTDGSVAIEVFGLTGKQLVPGTSVYVGGHCATIEQVRRSGRTTTVLFDNATSVKEADALRNKIIEIEASKLPNLLPGTFYHYQIIGSNVCSKEGKNLGTVTSIIETGSNDVFVVQQPKTRAELLVPAVSDVIISVDLERSIITVDLPPGLR